MYFRAGVVRTRGAIPLKAWAPWTVLARSQAGSGVGVDTAVGSSVALTTLSIAF